MIDTISGLSIPLPRASEAIRDIAATPDARTIAVASDDGTVYVGEKHGDTWMLATWTSLRAHAREIVFTHDGLLIMICADGKVWVYSSINHAWQCRIAGTTQLTKIMMDAAEKTAHILDADGRLLSLDIDAFRTHSPS